MTKKSKHESCKTDMVDGFTYRIWRRRKTLRGAPGRWRNFTIEPSGTITESKGNWGTKKPKGNKRKAHWYLSR